MKVKETNLNDWKWRESANIISSPSKYDREKQLDLDECIITCGGILITTKKFTYEVFDEYYQGDIGDDPNDNGLKTEEDFEIWRRERFSNARVKGGHEIFSDPPHER